MVSLQSRLVRPAAIARSSRRPTRYGTRRRIFVGQRVASGLQARGLPRCGHGSLMAGLGIVMPQHTSTPRMEWKVLTVTTRIRGTEGRSACLLQSRNEMTLSTYAKMTSTTVSLLEMMLAHAAAHFRGLLRRGVKHFNILLPVGRKEALLQRATIGNARKTLKEISTRKQPCAMPTVASSSRRP